MPTRSLEDRFWSKVKKTDGCWEWQASKDKKGYGCFRVGGRIEYAHRVAYSLANGIELLWEGYDSQSSVRHSCDNPACVNPSHLLLGTHTDNMRDCVSRGRKNPAFGDRHGSKTHPESVLRGNENPMRKHPELALRGSSNGAAKITEPMAREVKRLLACGVTQREASRKTGVGYHTVHKISKGEQWKHVQINQTDLKAAA